MAEEEKRFLDIDGLSAYDIEIKKYIEELLAKQAQQIKQDIQEVAKNVAEF